MKKIGIILQVMLCLLLSACGKEPTKEIELLAVEPELFRYTGTEQVQRIAVDENGLLYTVYQIEPLEEEAERVQHFAVYDLDGTCIKEVDIALGEVMIHSMTVKDGMLYCVTPRSGIGPVLYAIDLTTWEVTEVAKLGEIYRDVDKIIVTEEDFYFFGGSPIAMDKEYNLHPDVLSFNYYGEVVGKLSRTEEHPQVELLDVDFPIAMLETNEHTIMIYQYTEENGFGFIEFDPEKETLKEVSWHNIGQAMALTECEDGYLYLMNSGLYYGTVDGVEAHITTDNSLLTVPAVYRKGFAFYYDYLEHVVERICITDVLKENKEIRMLVNYSDDVRMYGCGYQMKKEEVDAETFSLKVLARDSDFDLYLLDSGHGNSYNIQKNGAFYALNDVPFVNEYLDACFPYLKEVATNEDGDIWMLPIEVNIPSIFYDKEYCGKQGIDLSAIDYKQFLEFTQRIELEAPGKIQNTRMLAPFFSQYLKLETSFDTELFRTYAKQLKNMSDSVGIMLLSKPIPVTINGVFQGELAEFFYIYQVLKQGMITNAQDVEGLGVSHKVGVVDVPKISPELSNLGTCAFFAVNPQSSDLEATLSYISTLCNYLMQQKDTFLLQDRTTYTDSTFIQQCYDVYANGEIYFAMESEVYYDVFQQYLEGNIALEDMIKEAERKRKIYMEE